jgi:hypothetical protein
VICTAFGLYARVLRIAAAKAFTQRARRKNAKIAKAVVAMDKLVKRQK